MKEYKDITIVIVTFLSDDIIYDFIKDIPKSIKVIIIENANNPKLKKNLEGKYKNVKVFLKKNDGVSASLNFGVKKVNTKYFIQLSPDVIVNYKDIKKFVKYAKKLNDNFCALGPRFLKTKKRGHIQINKDLRIGKIDSIHGSYMFFNTQNFNNIGGFDRKIFLYFEETEYCYRGKKYNLNSYQINSIKTQTIDTTVQINNNKKKRENWLYLLIWHFIWSKFYFSKKRFGYVLSLIFFIPIIIRIFFRLFIYFFSNNKPKLRKYKFRLHGLYHSIIGNESFLRLKDIKD
tara:strand:+ start:572 stop:1438 length:867 start_codon:yes stop_codon:yes gene_type:complete